ncbi:hypothetical protein ACHAXS_001071 [Conticribra weissflogii]
MNGCLGGLVSITGSCGVVEPWAAVIIGFVAGLSYLLTSKLLVRLRIDDAVDAIPVHMTNGLWGTFAVGLFASPTRIEYAYGQPNDVGVFMGGNGILLLCQIISILFVLGWVACLMIPFFCLLNYMGRLRAESVDEVEGLDYRYHGSRKHSTLSVENDTAMHISLSYGEGNRKLLQSIKRHEERRRRESGQEPPANNSTRGGDFGLGTICFEGEK